MDDGGRSFATIPDRPPLREVNVGNSQGSIEEGMRRKANEAHEKAIRLRSEARRDALEAVYRARGRRDGDLGHWTALEADTTHAITDLLVLVQGHNPGPLDPAFADRDRTVAMAAEMSSKIEEAVRTPPNGGNSTA